MARDVFAELVEGFNALADQRQGKASGLPVSPQPSDEANGAAEIPQGTVPDAAQQGSPCPDD